MNQYLERTYPQDEFVIQKNFYNFKDSGYNFAITKVGQEQQTEYEFVVTGLLGSNIHIDGIYYANQDEKLIEKLVKEANEELKNSLKEKVPEVLEVNVQMEVLKGKYPATTSWTKEFTPEVPMYIYIAIDAREFSKESFFKVSKNIQKKLNQEEYRYDHVTINGNIIDSSFQEENGEKNWIVEYASFFEKDSKLQFSDVEQVE